MKGHIVVKGNLIQKENRAIAIRDRFLKCDEVAILVGMGISTIYKKIKEGKFPPPFHPNNGKMARWSEIQILAWMSEQTQYLQVDFCKN